jgi:hypothetical protein
MTLFNGIVAATVGLTVTTHSLVIHGGTVVADVGLTVATNANVNYNGQFPSASVGISTAASGSINRTGTSDASMGITVAAGGMVTHGGSVTSSLGISVSANGRLRYWRGSAAASIEITTVLKPGILRAGNASLHVGITTKLRAILVPGLNLPNTIILFEATDAQNPATYAAILPRDYHKIILDQTVDSYPQPFTLLN